MPRTVQKPSNDLTENLSEKISISAEARFKDKQKSYDTILHADSGGIWCFEFEKPISIHHPSKKQIELMLEFGVVAESNITMAHMHQQPSTKKMLGMRLSELFNRSEQANINFLQSFIESNYNLHNLETRTIDHKDRTKHYINSLIGVVENGKLIRAWGTQHDVTEHHQTTEALRTSEARLALALKASHLGMWEWDVQTGVLTWSDKLKKMYGLQPTDQISYELYLSMLHPDDVPKLRSIIARSMESGRSYEVEHRVVWPDGSLHWILGRGQAILENGNPVRMIGTSMDIDNRKASEALRVKYALLNAERKELLQLNASKDEFIALASHQLRTPATSVKQYLGMLLEGYAGELKLTKQQLAMLRTAYESNDRQIRIVNDLLMVATVDAGKVHLQPKTGDVIRLIEDIIDEYLPTYRSRQQELVLSSRESSLKIMFDPERLRMAIENLIDNASKYSPEKSKITILVSRHESRLVIKVKDKGVGIEKMDIPKLFQKFSRIPNELSTTTDGTGLGLYWSKEIIHLHGGKLTVTSKPGIGTTFTISLPVRALKK